MLHPANFDKMPFSFSFDSKYFYIALEISSLTHELFRSMLFNLHVFWDVPVFFLLLIFSLIPLWSEYRRCMISLALNIRCVLWPRTWFVLVNVLCELEKNVCSVVLDWSSL